MAIYELQNATLGELEGQGFAYTRKVSSGKSYQGVFFAEDHGDLEPLQEASESLTYAGTVYDGNREKQEEFPVAIVKVVSTPSGERAEFERVEEEDE
jgi:hypothetical protein